MMFTPMEERRVAIGMDLGQSRDPTTIAVIERVREVVPAYLVDQLRNAGEHGRARLAQMQSECAKAIYNLRMLEQAPLGESYPAQAQRLKRLLCNPNLADQRVPVWMDYTGVGRAVFDIFAQAGVPNLRPTTLVFAGQEGPNAQGGHSVPKVDMVSRIQAAMHSGRLRIPVALPLVATFKRELQDFRVSYTATGAATFNAASGRHDDTLTAVGLALYGLDGRRELQMIRAPWAA